jgi:uncharacterized protein
MKIDTVRHLLDITAPHYKQINIIWHGGEPLLMGLDFYKEVIRLQQAYSCTIKNSIQSNLTLLTPQMADFFVEQGIYVSGSFDGVCNEQLRGHDPEILSARQLMVDRGQKCGLIMVVSKKNIDHLVESYELFKALQCDFSLNLYLNQNNFTIQQLCLEKGETVEKITELFNYWAYDTSGIHISYFDNILKYILLGKKTVCTYTSCLGKWMAVHYNGEISPCNRYFSHEYSYGNICDYNDIGEAFESDGFKLLITQAIYRRKKCKECDIYDFCSGGCNNVAFNENGITNNGGLSCQILRSIYKHIEKFLSDSDSLLEQKDRINPLLINMIRKHSTTQNSGSM